MDSPARRIRLEFESRVLSLAKDADYPDENQDCCRVDHVGRVAALADGVSSAIFSRLWAKILVEAAVEGFPDPSQREPFACWLSERREAWRRQIDVSRLAWFQKPKLREGAFSTLLTVRLIPPADEPAEGESEWRLRAIAIGDTCMFHIRDGKVVRKFPVQTAAELERDPAVIGSVDLRRDDLLEFQRVDEPCLPGDLVVLCTDALADWALRAEQSGSPPKWPAYWDMPQAVWEGEIKALRNDRTIRFDDTTLVLLQIAGQSPPGPAPVALPAAEIPAPDQDWVRTLEEISGQVGRQLSDGAAWAVKRLKGVSQTARSAIEKAIRKIGSDDRD
jgi:hypothetical protein